MKQILFVLTALMCNITVFAQTAEVKRALDKFDVKKHLGDITSRNPTLFWYAIEDNNERVQKINKKLAKKNKTVMKVCGETLKGVMEMQKYDDVVDGYDTLTTKLAKDLGITIKTQTFPIRIIRDDTFNASMDPMGQMRVNRGTLRYLTYEELLAVCAHETAHLYCEHIIDSNVKTEKKRKNNEMWAGIGAGFVLGAAAVSGGISQGMGYQNVGAEQMMANAGVVWETFSNEAHDAVARFSFRYSRDQELEADIIAYRFMEFMGYGTEHWVSAIRKMVSLGGSNSVKEAGKYDDHPSPLFRLQVVAAMESGYVGKGK